MISPLHPSALASTPPYLPPGTVHAPDRYRLRIGVECASRRGFEFSTV
jgi:hypothetical protein